MKIRKVKNEFPYIVEFVGLSFTQWQTAYDWCQENFGEPYDSIDGSSEIVQKWVKQWNGIRFKQEAYATWFILRFSGDYN